MKEDIQDRLLQLDEEDPGFQLLVFLQLLNKGSIVIFFLIFIITTYVIKFSINCFLGFFSFRAMHCFINLDVLPQLIRISEGKCAHRNTCYNGTRVIQFTLSYHVVIYEAVKLSWISSFV
jgi:hypothetical protein